MASASPPPNAAREAYVTLLYGDFYVMPVRVMMQSLLVNSPDVAAGRRERVVIVTGSTSARAVDQMLADGISVRKVPPMRSPYTGDAKFHARFVNVMTKLYVFNMTDYARIVFLDADTLVLRDMSPLFSCGVFCAAFINPCYFNSGLMLVSPNATLFADMQRVLPTTPSYDGGDQGFLNSYFPSLLKAPIFDATVPPKNPPPPLARLPFSWHVDHSAFFPTNAFEFEKSDRCGPRRMIEWLGPPICKPWLWWSYSTFDLSWTWNVYRRQLRDPYPPGMSDRRNGVLLIVFCYAAIGWLANGFMSRRAKPFFLARLLPRLCPFRGVSARLSCLYPVIAGFLWWLVGLVVCALVVPRILPPYQAAVVFFHLRVLDTLTILICGGLLFCAGQKHGGRARGAYPLKGKGMRKAFNDMLAWAVFDGAYLIAWSALLWQISFPTMWLKGVAILAVIGSQAVLVALMLARTYLTWLRLSDSAWSGDVMS